MALEYDIYVNSEIDSDILLSEALQFINVEIIKKNNPKTIEIDLWENLGINIFVYKSFSRTFEIKGNVYNFNRLVSVLFDKFFEDRLAREKNIFTIVKFIIERSGVNEILFVFNGETIILLKDKDGLKLNFSSGFISENALSIFLTTVFLKEDFVPDDLNVI